MGEVNSMLNHCCQQHLESCSIDVRTESGCAQYSYLIQNPLSVANTDRTLTVTNKLLLKDGPRESVLSDLPSSWDLPAM